MSALKKCKYLYASSLMILLSSCDTNMKFQENLSASSQDVMNTVPQETSIFFNLASGETSFTQPSLEKNTTTISFQVKNPQGILLNSIQNTDLLITENSINVPNFKLSKNTVSNKQTVDIVFAVDVTASMSPTIESAKIRLTNFVNNSRSAGYHTRMCLITFGDYTVQKCNKFYDNNPSDPSTLTQVNELISEISKLKALKGAEDPGGRDFNENPMRALIDASNAPWADNNQRFLILITDDGFLYSPNNTGAIGAGAPYYSEVKQALTLSQMKVFAATPSMAGYNRPFGSDASIVDLSQGEWFNFADLISGAITLDTILNRIITNVNTTFIAEYTVDDIPQLDAALPLNQRNISLQLKSNALGTLQSVSIKSNLPNGREAYKNEFFITSKRIKSNSLRVVINNAPVSSGISLTASGYIKFNQAPTAQAKITISYSYADLKDALVTQPVVIPKNSDISLIKVYLNRILADKNHYKFERNLEGQYSLVLNDAVLNSQDIYQIFQNQGLQVLIKH
ncbi:MAG: vWA domain-containing protein [Pseudobdellovibrio sp.]